ncbi:MAG: DUF2442 domain-containing protein [Verrucomicrobia bacterium]|nr:DUF2442 domain-containing protein [Verrucomicrobiota bacterium]
MNAAEINDVRISEDRLTFDLADGRCISVPLAFYPTLFHASQEERQNFERYPFSVYWPDLDCDIGVEGMLQGAKELPIYAAKAEQRIRDSKAAA